MKFQSHLGHGHSHTTRRVMRPPLDADGPWIPRQESRIILTPTIAPPPPPPKPAEPEPPKPKLTPQQERLKRAIYIDRSYFSCSFSSFICLSKCHILDSIL